MGNLFKRMKLSEIGQIVAGGTPKTKIEEYWNGDISWITPKDLSSHTSMYISKGERSISQEGLDNSSAKLLPKGTVLFTSRAPIGYVAIAKKEVTTNQGFKSIIVNNENDNVFVYYLLRNNISLIENHANGSTFKEISGKVMNALEFDIPSLMQQKNIANILSTIDDKIEINNQINKTLESMAQAIFTHWFVDFEFPNEDGEPYKSSGGEMVESELGMIPKGWKVVKLQDIMHINPQTKLIKGDLYKFVSMKELSEGSSKINLKNVNYKEYKSGGMKFLNGDTLLARITPCLENGKTGYVNFLAENEKGFGSTEFIVMRAKEGVKSSLTYIIARNKDFRDYAVKHMNGSSGRQRVNKDSVGDYKIAIPSNRALLNQLGQIGDNFFIEMRKNEFENDVLINLRDTLLPKLMSGEIRVPIDNN